MLTQGFEKSHEIVRQLRSLRSNEGLSRAQIRPNFYPEVVRGVLLLTGIENRQADLLAPSKLSIVDYRPVIRYLNSEIDIGLSRKEQDVIALLLTGLSRTNRFSGDVFIEFIRGEDSSIHSCHSAILVVEIFRRAGLLSSEHLSSSTLQELRRAMIIGALLHDCGEILGEIHSLANRVAQAGLSDEDKVCTERGIFRTFLRLACFAVEQKNPRIFFEVLEKARALAGITTGSKVNHEGLAEALKQSQVTLTPETEQTYVKLMRHYDRAELHLENPSDLDLFIAYCIKNCEHLQGTRHMIRRSTKHHGYQPLRHFSAASTPFEQHDPQRDRFSLPFALAHSARMMAGAKFTERELGHVFATAKYDLQIALANAMRHATYETLRELLHAGPLVINQPQRELPQNIVALEKVASDFTQKESERLNAFRELQRLLQYSLRENIATLRGDVDNELSIADRGYFMQVYSLAAARGYIPARGEVLLHNDVRDIPPAIRPEISRKGLLTNGSFTMPHNHIA